MRRLGFTMIELIFVIVVMGILGKFGVEFLAQAYNNFIFSSVNNSLQANGEMAVETIASKLQYRIKDSIIGRRSDGLVPYADSFAAPASIATIAAATAVTPEDYNILEWVGTDIDGYRGDSLPYWSGIIDLDRSRNILSRDTLISPETNTTALNTLIGILSPANTTGINNTALYFIGSDSDIQTGYGWDGSAIADQNATMHPVRRHATIEDRLIADTGANDFNGTDVYEYYQLAWTAYAVGITDYNTTAMGGNDTGTLTLWYDYQPWEGEKYTDGNSSVLMENVSTFRYNAVGSVIKIQVCVNSDLVEDYSLCKEKTVF